MRLVSFQVRERESFGRIEQSGSLTDLGRFATTLASALARYQTSAALARLDGPSIPSDGVAWLPPIPHPAKVFCVGFNFRDHAVETGRNAPVEPTLFARNADTFVGHEQPVLRPAVSEQLDWEGEVAVVIGRLAWQVSETEALSVVAGYTCMAENSVRDWQMHGTQATAGKNFWRSGSAGPALVTADEVGDPSQLSLTTRLNGTVMQSASLANLVFSVPRIIEYITTFTPLAPGDIIAMGTPSGTGSRRDPPRYLQPGDTLEVEVPGLGVLRNPVADVRDADVRDERPSA